MNKTLLVLSIAAFMFVACGDDSSSASPTKPVEESNLGESSSSESSSSEKSAPLSSSSVAQSSSEISVPSSSDDVESSSSDVVAASSSSETSAQSSSDNAESSSSDLVAESSSSDAVAESSSSDAVAESSSSDDEYEDEYEDEEDSIYVAFYRYRDELSDTIHMDSSWKKAENWRIACVEEINILRATEGLPPLARAADKEACIDEQAQLDLDANKGHANFRHCGETSQNTAISSKMYIGDWTDENLKSYAFMANSGFWMEKVYDVILPAEDVTNEMVGHYKNMIDPRHTSVACGYAATSSKIWIDVDFYK